MYRVLVVVVAYCLNLFRIGRRDQKRNRFTQYALRKIVYGKAWESNPPTPALRRRPLILKTKASTGTHAPPLDSIHVLLSVMQTLRWWGQRMRLWGARLMHAIHSDGKCAAAHEQKNGLVEFGKNAANGIIMSTVREAIPILILGRPMRTRWPCCVL